MSKCGSCGDCSCGKQEGAQEDKVEEFVEGKVYVLVEFFKIGNETYKTTYESLHSCEHCDLEYSIYCGIMRCTSSEVNSKGVQYILYDEDS